MEKHLKKKGHEVYSVEWDKQHENIDLYADIRTLTSSRCVRTVSRVMSLHQEGQKLERKD